ncbi:uncharacterized protein LOC130645186 [Hydractinia symbiolongicarpus]|uniref:uncharacterized protein LOC130645186 n=1 Tax=Hydractinia symbiolongicarpus TaxID=13093 RepID=UPI002551B0D9|nr:uncharacterized protein LOC130645186 [Hydractinia symbiolongicarpus]
MAVIAAIVATFIILQSIYIVKNLKRIFPPIRHKKWYKLAQVLCHCGPVILFIIASIVIYFVKLIEINFKKSKSKWIPILHSVIAVYLWINVTFNYFAAMVTKAGKPPSREELNLLRKNIPEHLDYCSTCERVRTYGTHHCRNCNTCIRMLCHHSSFINNCVGLSNFAYYFTFLCYSFVGLLFAFYVTYSSFDACYIHDHTLSDVSLKYPALNLSVCEDIGELPLFVMVIVAALVIISSLLLIHCILLAADLSYISFVKHIQEAVSIRNFVWALIKKCFKKQRRIKFSFLLKNRRQSWKYFLFPSFNILPDELTLDDLIEDDSQCYVQMI